MQNVADKQQVIDWLTHLRKTENRRDKWTVQALNLINDILQKQHLIWEILQKAGEENGLKQMFPTLREKGKANLEQTLWAEAVRTLFVVAIHYERERHAAWANTQLGRTRSLGEHAAWANTQLGRTRRFAPTLNTIVWEGHICLSARYSGRTRCFAPTAFEYDGLVGAACLPDRNQLRNQL